MLPDLIYIIFGDLNCTLYSLKINYVQLLLPFELTKRALLRRRETVAIDTRLSAWKLGLTDTQTHTHTETERDG